MNWFQIFMSMRLCSMKNGIHKNFVKFKGNHMWQRFFFKVAHVVRLKLTFMELFFYNLVILIKLYKIWYLDLDKDKALLFPKTHGIWLKNWKLWRLPQSLIFFCWNFAHLSYLTMSTKRFSGFFLFCLDLDLLIEMYKTSV